MYTRGNKVVQKVWSVRNFHAGTRTDFSQLFHSFSLLWTGCCGDCGQVMSGMVGELRFVRCFLACMHKAKCVDLGCRRPLLCRMDHHFIKNMETWPKLGIATFYVRFEYVM